MNHSQNKYIVVFDGVCNFCNSAVNFIIARDPDAVFAFAPLQTEFAQQLIEKHASENMGMDTFLLFKNGKCFLWSDAALEISKDLSGYWFCFNALQIIPSPIRNFFYRLFAKHRYRVFGRTEHCIVPAREVAGRFIGF